MTFKEKQRRHDHFMGGIESLGVFGVIFMLYIIFCNPLMAWFMLSIIFLLIFLMTFGILPFKRGFIMDAIDKIKGMIGTDGKITDMKLAAIAKHLNVKLLHVPEHFACKPIEHKKSEVATNAGDNN